MTGKVVLVTGGSGFIGSHVIVQALKSGYRVRTTVRSKKRAELLHEKIRNGGVPEQLATTVEIYEADLSSAQGWEEACRGCDYVLHVASPFPPSLPKNDDDLIKPACEGTLNVLKASKKAGTVKRVVITSSFAAVGYGHKQRNSDNPFTERDWTILENPERPIGPYERSKTIAEKAAWKWLKEEGAGIEMVTVNPVVVLGPSLGKEENTSLEIPAKLLNGDFPALPKVSFGIVDVRDVADLHIKAMETPEAAGNRYIAISDEPSVSMKDIEQYLKDGLPRNETRKVPTMELPNFLVRMSVYFDPSVRLIVNELGLTTPTSNAKARQELKWHPRSAKDAVLGSVDSLKKTGRVKA